MLSLPTSWPCFSKANVRDWAPLRLLVNSVTLNNAIFSCWNSLKLKAPWLCKAKRAGQRPTIGAPRRWSVRSFVIVSWIPMLRPRSSPKSSSKPTISLAFEASSESSATLVCKKNSTPVVLKACPSKSRPSGPDANSALSRATRPALSERFVNCWQIRFPATKSESGSWRLSIFAWALGICSVLGARAADKRSGRAWALHLVHEAAFCVNGLRNQRSLTQKGFELSNGLPFVPTDFAIHEMLGRHTMAEAQALQVALGKIRRASGHFQGRLLGIDPHRIKSCTKRQMRRHRFSAKEKALKMAQCFFCLDLDSAQPLCFTLASAARTVTQATPELLELSQEILNPAPDQAPLVLADSEHYTTELLDHVHLDTPFELLVPMPPQNSPKLRDQALNSERFHRRWAGYATTKEPFRLKQSRCPEPYYRFVQRNGERAE